ncbi:hypothetical protein Cgig2_001839 [Carnegiea gigantea]|uniref:Uncharacterized protein n=1 Tax=Carnegiea gigantea TaxID=171969 RepID=A0A9Q1JZC5_9CARY|nr:hypothetical protein Cgig2_001839 [Carnegiea gigantea]
MYLLDFERSENGEILMFKIHDLMHDMAQQASGKEIFIADSATMDLDKKTCHLCDSAPYDRTKDFITATTAKIRSYAQCGDRFGDAQFPMRALLANWRSLRVLDLGDFRITYLPNAIGELLHLRWLNLDDNQELKKLPKSLTKLINLQTLSVERCSKLEELPEDFSKLINLRTLYVPHDKEGGLRYMPLGMEKMASLTRLNEFVLGQRKSSMKGEVRLEDLRVPRNLRDSVEICISPNYKHSKEYGGGGGYLCNTKYLKSISMEWPEEYEEEMTGNDDVLEDLQPHSNLKELIITNYPSNTDGAATTIAASFSTAVEITDSSIFFPSLENLELVNMPKLRGWWRRSSRPGMRDGEIAGGQRRLLFPRLSRVTMAYCPNLRSIPLGPAVETLFLEYSGIMEEDEDQKVVGDFERNENGEILMFRIHDLMHDMAQQASGKEIFVADSATMDLDKKTRYKRMDNDDVLGDLQPHSNLKELIIANYPRSTIPRWAREDRLTTFLPNLAKVCLEDCNGLKELPWLGKLQRLKTLQLYRLENLEYMENKTRGTNIGSNSDGASTTIAASSSTAVEIILRGWWRRSSRPGMKDGEIAGGQRLLLFPRLSRVTMAYCPNLRSIPLGPAVETLFLEYSGIMEEDENQKVVGGFSSNDSGNSGSNDPKSKK